MTNHAIFAILIFLAVYGAIIVEKVHKTLISLLGICAFLFLHLIPFEEGVSHIDMNVIFLLIGMMILVNITHQSGVFEYIALWSAKKVKADPKKLLGILFVITALFSAFLDNVTTVLLIGPVSLLIASQLKIDPRPFLLTEIFASNIGGTATLIGDPPNIMIGSAANLTFIDFLFNLGPVILFQIILFVLIFIFVFRGKLRVSNIDRVRIMDINEKKLIKDKILLKKSLTVLAFVIVGFLFHGFLKVEASVVALCGSGILAIWTKTEPEEVLKTVEWATILFFIFLFMIVGGLVYTGVVKTIAEAILNHTAGNLRLTSGYILWFTGIASGILDNIPLVATFIPIIKLITVNSVSAQTAPIWWSLALGACLGGNGTVIGASANVIMIDFAKRNNIAINFLSFLKYSIPITFLSLFVSYIYIMIFYF